MSKYLRLCSLLFYSENLKNYIKTEEFGFKCGKYDINYNETIYCIKNLSKQKIELPVLIHQEAQLLK